jgi:predicted amidohydrolase YtcJ
MAIEADRLGLQIFVHAVGDGAVRQTLDGYEAVRKVNGPRDSRPRIEHVELVHPDDLPRFAGLGVIAPGKTRTRGRFEWVTGAGRVVLPGKPYARRARGWRLAATGR